MDLPREVSVDPFATFGRWFADAQTAGNRLPEAFALATVDASGSPSARIVLLKHFDSSGFSFFTNYDSRKSVELAANTKCSLVFHWPELERQVRVEGLASRTSAKESAEYFRTRPRGSRIGAWASPQSQTIPSRADLERRFAEFDRKFSTENIPCPDNWGGFRVVPTSIEFWMGRESRLHDRVLFERKRLENAEWTISLLAP